MKYSTDYFDTEVEAMKEGERCEVFMGLGIITGSRFTMTIGLTSGCLMPHGGLAVINA